MSKYIFLLIVLLPLRCFSQTFTDIGLGLGMDFAFVDYSSIGGGASFFDYDGDGDDDLYMTMGRLMDRLYRNDGNGQFTDVTIESGLDLTVDYYTVGVTTGDIDNDGFREIFLTTFGNATSLGPYRRNLLFKNMGDGTFQEIGIAANLLDGAASVSATFIDHDLDGFLDIYVANYIRGISFDYDEEGNLIFTHDCYENFFYHNNGNSTFTEVARELQIDDEGGCSLATTNTDFDMDSDSDIYLANDFGEFIIPNQLFENQDNNGVFDTISQQSGAGYRMYGMGIAVGDYDLDNDLDYYVTNLGSNVLLNNDGNGNFSNVANAANVENTNTIDGLLSTSWGTAFADVDNDLYEDLFVSNGHIPAADFIATGEQDHNKLYHNNGNQTFTDISSQAGIASPQKNRGFAYSDFDGDGDVDVFVNTIARDNEFSRVHFFRNDLVSQNNWVEIKLEGVDCNRDAIGAQVRVFAGNRVLIREVSGGGSHASQNSSVAHFGLASNNEIDSVLVSWPGGEIESFYDIDVNQKHTLIQTSVTNKVNINFQLDMTFQIPSEDGVFVVVWDENQALERKLLYASIDDENIYSASLMQDVGFNGYYTFTNGNCDDFVCAENLSPYDCVSSDSDYHRLLSPVLNDTIINACFGICPGEVCRSTIDSFNVHFTLNAAPLDEEWGQIYLVGIPFEYSVIPMQDENDDGFFEIDLTLEEGFTGDYIFTNGFCQDLSCSEDLTGQECASEENNYFRHLDPVLGDIQLSACFGVCNADSCFAPVDTFRVQFNLDMNNEDIHPTGVYIVGDYFGTSSATPLYDGNDDGIFTNFFMIPENEVVYYTFRNGSFCPDQSCFESLEGQDCAYPEQDNYRFLGVITEDTVLDHCFGSCVAECTQVIDSIDISFHINMAPVQTSPEGVYWFNSSNNTEQLLLNDPEDDDIFTITIRQPLGYTDYYSFNNGDCPDLSCREDLTGQNCGDPSVLDYRYLEPVYSDTILNLCFEECQATICEAPIDSVELQFNVNMASVEMISEDGVFLIEGIFGMPGNFELEDTNDDEIFQIIVRQPMGFSGSYSFANGNCLDLSCKEDITGLACANSNNSRWLNPVMQDTIINACFGECRDDLECTIIPSTASVQFGVDMQQQIVSSDGVWMEGNFDIASEELFLQEIDGIWTTNLELLPGTYTYRFINGDHETGMPELLELDTENECSDIVDQIRYRTLLVPEVDMLDLPVYCYDQCAACIVDNVNTPVQAKFDFQLKPNITDNGTNLVCSTSETFEKEVNVFNAVGQLVETFRMEAWQNELYIDTSNLPQGVYWVAMEADQYRRVRKLIIQN